MQKRFFVGHCRCKLLMESLLESLKLLLLLKHELPLLLLLLLMLLLLLRCKMLML